MKINNCIHCEIEFVVKDESNYFCSTDCYENYTGRKSNLYEKVCASCNQSYKGNKTSIYCSKKCARSAKLMSKEELAKEKDTCANEVCQKQFVRKTRNHIYCSEECRFICSKKALESTLEVLDGSYKLVATEIKAETKLYKNLCCSCFQNFDTNDSEEIFCSKRCRGGSRKTRTHYAIFNRDGFRCGYCGSSPLKQENVILSLDHVVPWVISRNDTASNIITSCMDCNCEKHTNIPNNVEEILEIVKERNIKYKINPNCIVNASTKDRKYSSQ
jgi:hypothetical protein